jgi:hypothetical protein
MQPTFNLYHALNLYHTFSNLRPALNLQLGVPSLTFGILISLPKAALISFSTLSLNLD